MKIYYYSDTLSLLYDQSVMLINFCYEQLVHISATLTF